MTRAGVAYVYPRLERKRLLMDRCDKVYIRTIVARIVECMNVRVIHVRVGVRI